MIFVTDDMLKQLHHLQKGRYGQIIRKFQVGHLCILYTINPSIQFTILRYATHARVFNTEVGTLLDRKQKGRVHIGTWHFRDKGWTISVHANFGTNEVAFGTCQFCLCNFGTQAVQFRYTVGTARVRFRYTPEKQRCRLSQRVLLQVWRKCILTPNIIFLNLNSRNRTPLIFYPFRK